MCRGCELTSREDCSQVTIDNSIDMLGAIRPESGNLPCSCSRNCSSSVSGILLSGLKHPIVGALDPCGSSQQLRLNIKVYNAAVTGLLQFFNQVSWSDC